MSNLRAKHSFCSILALVYRFPSLWLNCSARRASSSSGWPHIIENRSKTCTNSQMRPFVDHFPAVVILSREPICLRSSMVYVIPPANPHAARVA